MLDEKQARFQEFLVMPVNKNSSSPVSPQRPASPKPPQAGGKESIKSSGPYRSKNPMENTATAGSANHGKDSQINLDARSGNPPPGSTIKRKPVAGQAEVGASVQTKAGTVEGNPPAKEVKQVRFEPPPTHGPGHTEEVGTAGAASPVDSPGQSSFLKVKRLPRDLPKLQIPPTPDGARALGAASPKNAHGQGLFQKKEVSSDVAWAKPESPSSPVSQAASSPAPEAPVQTEVAGQGAGQKTHEKLFGSKRLARVSSAINGFTQAVAAFRSNTAGIQGGAALTSDPSSRRDSVASVSAPNAPAQAAAGAVTSETQAEELKNESDGVVQLLNDVAWNLRVGTRGEPSDLGNWLTGMSGWLQSNHEAEEKGTTLTGAELASRSLGRCNDMSKEIQRKMKDADPSEREKAVSTGEGFGPYEEVGMKINDACDEFKQGLIGKQELCQTLGKLGEEVARVPTSSHVEHPQSPESLSSSSEFQQMKNLTDSISKLLREVDPSSVEQHASYLRGCVAEWGEALSSATDHHVSQEPKAQSKWKKFKDKLGHTFDQVKKAGAAGAGALPVLISTSFQLLALASQAQSLSRSSSASSH